MAYNAVIPQASDRIKDSQTAILANFTALNGVLDVNGGFLSLPKSAVTPAIGANNKGIFCRTSAYTTNPELCILSTGGVATEFTSYGYAGAGLQPLEGWARLPSGILLKWGQGQATGQATFVWSVGANIPVFSSVINCQITTRTNFDAVVEDIFVTLQTFSPTGADFYVSKRTTVAPAQAKILVFMIGV